MGSHCAWLGVAGGASVGRAGQGSGGRAGKQGQGPLGSAWRGTDWQASHGGLRSER